MISFAKEREKKKNKKISLCAICMTLCQELSGGFQPKDRILMCDYLPTEAATRYISEQFHNSAVILSLIL